MADNAIQNAELRFKQAEEARVSGLNEVALVKYAAATAEAAIEQAKLQERTNYLLETLINAQADANRAAWATVEKLSE